jgi:hypothetical protein
MWCAFSYCAAVHAQWNEDVQKAISDVAGSASTEVSNVLSFHEY